MIESLASRAGGRVAASALGPLLAAVLMIGCAIAAAGCASGLTVRSDEDPGADFSVYRSYNFFEPMGIEGGSNSPVYGELFREAIGREMRQRGYRVAPEPDLLINVTFRVDDKVRMTSHTTPYMSGAYYAQPGGAQYGSALGVGVGVGSRPKKITEASVFIDLVDAEQHRVSWQGVAVIDANDKVAQQLRDAIFTAVNRVYDLYPYRASP
jgi:hypothetical protein